MDVQNSHKNEDDYKDDRQLLTDDCSKRYTSCTDD